MILNDTFHELPSPPYTISGSRVLKGGMGHVEGSFRWGVQEGSLEGGYVRLVCLWL